MLVTLHKGSAAHWSETPGVSIRLGGSPDAGPRGDPEDATRHRAARAEFDAYQATIYGPAYARR